MEPTVVECEAFRSIEDVLIWAGFTAKPADGEDITTARGALLARLDVKAEEHPRIVGNLAEEASNPMTVGERSKGEMFGKASRIFSGRDERIEVVRKRKADVLALDLARATTAGVPSGAAAAAAALATLAVKKMKIATVADQANDLEVPELGNTEVVAAYARFEDLTGGPPATNEELTIDQLTSLHALLQGSGPPYVDFAVWGPFGHRISKKMKMTGLVIGSKGELRQTECFGPSSFSDWEQSFRVWRTGCLMLNAITSSALDQYHDLIQRYFQRYGPSVWLILY